MTSPTDWLDRVARWAQYVVSHHRTFPLEMLLILLSSAIGSWLLVPAWNTLQVLGLYRAIGVLPEWFWGHYFLGVAAYYTLGIYMSVRRRRIGPWICLQSAGALAFAWLTWAIDFGVYNVELLGVPVWGGLSLGALWVCWRLSIVVRREKYREVV